MGVCGAGRGGIPCWLFALFGITGNLMKPMEALASTKWLTTQGLHTPLEACHRPGPCTTFRSAPKLHGGFELHYILDFCVVVTVSL